MKPTKNEVSIKDTYYRKYDEIYVKASKKDLLVLEKLVRTDDFQKGLEILERIESGKENIEFSYEFNDDGLTIKIPKNLLKDKENFNDKGYAPVYNFGSFKALPLYDGSNLAFQIGIINWKELKPKK
jgi:hypothetical protein